LKRLIFSSIFSLAVGLPMSEYVHAEDPELRFNMNVQGAGAALSCGNRRLVKQLKSATLEYFALRPEGFDLTRIEKKFDGEVARIRAAMGDSRSDPRSSTNCEQVLLRDARRSLSETQKLLPPLRASSQAGRSPK